MTATESDRVRAAELAGELAAAGARFVARAKDLAPDAGELARLDAELRAVEGRLGRRRRGPSPAQLAADVVLGHLAALRPNVPFVTSAAGEAAAELLCRDRQLTMEGAPGA